MAGYSHPTQNPVTATADDRIARIAEALRKMPEDQSSPYFGQEPWPARAVGALGEFAVQAYDDFIERPVHGTAQALFPEATEYYDKSGGYIDPTRAYGDMAMMSLWFPKIWNPAFSNLKNIAKDSGKGLKDLYSKAKDFDWSEYMKGTLKDKDILRKVSKLKNLADEGSGALFGERQAAEEAISRLYRSHAIPPPALARGADKAYSAIRPGLFPASAQGSLMALQGAFSEEADTGAKYSPEEMEKAFFFDEFDQPNWYDYPATQVEYDDQYLDNLDVEEISKYDPFNSPQYLNYLDNAAREDLREFLENRSIEGF